MEPRLDSETQDLDSPAANGQQPDVADDAEAAESEKDEQEKASSDEEASEDEDDDLDDDDLDLIAENTGRKIVERKKFKRLKRRTDDEDRSDTELIQQPKRPATSATALQDLFDDEDTITKPRKPTADDMETDEEDEEEGQIVGGAARSGEDEDEGMLEKRRPFASRYDARQEEDLLDDEDDLDDFIVDDDEAAGDRANQERPRKEERRRATGGLNIASQLGIPADIWHEVFEVFGDGSDYAYALGPTNAEDELDDYAEDRQSKKIEDVFEPAEVAEKMFTDRDDEIRNTDLPERFQLREFPHRVPHQDEMNLETEWIVQAFCKKRSDLSNLDQFGKAVSKVLHFLRVDCLETPFIIRHRKDYYDGYLEDQDIWEINDLDERWNHMTLRRTALQHWFEIAPELTRLIREAADEDAMKDISDYLQVRYKKEMENMKGANGILGEEDQDTEMTNKADTTRKLKRPVRSDMYTMAKEANLHNFVKKFCISSSDFALNFGDAAMHVSPEDPEISPTDLAKEFVNDTFTRPEMVLKAARYMIAQEIASEPIVRAVLRVSIFDESTISVRPTERGRAEVDEFHEYYPIKYIHEQPLKKFRKDDYLWLHKAEKEGLLTSNIDSDLSTIYTRVEQFFLGFNTSEIAEQWKEERRTILRIAFQEILLPQIRRWMTDKLVNDATEFVIGECKNVLKRKVNYQPYRKLVEDGDGNDRREIRSPDPSRICAISCGDGNSGTATFAVFVDNNGEVVDHLKLNFINSRQAEDKRNDCDKLTEFIRGSEVDMVVVAGWTMQTRHMFDTVRECAMSALGNIPVVFGNDDVARIFRNSKRGQEDFPNFSPLLKYCISVARTAQEPLFEYAHLFNTQRDILYLKMHPLQEMVPHDRLYSSLERVMIDVVNLVGIDVNEALSNPRIAHAVQFICGLGPRKAPTVLTKIKSRCNTLESRSDLIHEVGLGKFVFVNCASFLRISADFASATYDVLDGTRIHPEDYALARKMAHDALENVTQMDGNKSTPVAEIMLNPENHHALMDLELDDFADQLLRDKGEHKRITLRMIAEEILSPYGERRPQFKDMTHDDVFTMLTGETDRTLHFGTVVNAVVRKKTEKSVFVNLDSGLDGIISAENSSERLSHTRTASILAGQGLRGVVIKVDKERFLVELDARENSIQRAAENRSRQNPFFDYSAERSDRETISHSVHDNDQLTTRSIQHPLFHNFDSRASEKYLAKRPTGDLVFRPSSRGKNSITLTWKIADGIYQHVQIDELKKDNDYALGKELMIGNMRYGDLDQIQAMYVEPMSHRATRLMKHPKFEPKFREELNAKADRDMLANPNRIPYYLGYSREAGKFILVYKFSPQDEARQETISLMPDGYRFRNQVFQEINDLIAFFKSKGAATGPSSGNMMQPPSGMMRPMAPMTAPSPASSMPSGPMMAPYQPMGSQQPMYGGSRPPMIPTTASNGPGYPVTPSPYYTGTYGTPGPTSSNNYGRVPPGASGYGAPPAGQRYPPSYPPQQNPGGRSYPPPPQQSHSSQSSGW